MSVARIPDGAGGFIDIDEEGNETPVPPKVDAGPSARRAMAGGRPGAAVPTDDELGISSPLATPAGRTMPTATGGGSQPVADLRPPPEPGLVHEDPIGTVVAGGYAAKAGGAASRAIPGVLGTLAEGATAAAVPTAVAGGSAKEVALAAGLGGVGNVVARNARPLIGAIGDKAAARDAENLVPSGINAGTRGSAAKRAVAAKELIGEAVQAHPDLGKVINSGAGAAEKAEAIDAKLEELEGKNTDSYKIIAANHPQAVDGRLPLARPVLKLQDLANKAHDAGDDTLRDAAHTAIDRLKQFADQNGTISPEQIRGVRNKLAKNVAKGAGLTLSDVAEETATVKATLNDAIHDLASETPDVTGKLAELGTRNRHIAGLMAAQNSLNAQVGSESLAPSKPLLSKALDVVGKFDVTHPLANVTKPLAAGVSIIDRHLASLAGKSGTAGVAALKAVALTPTRQTLQEAIRVGIPAQIALQVARLGAQPAGAQ